MAEKTEQPTPKKLQDAKKKGQIASSKDATSAATFLVGMSVLLIFAKSIGTLFDDLYRLVANAIPRVGAESVSTIYETPLREAVLAIIIGSGPVVAGVVVIGVALSAAQAGLNVTFEPMKPTLNKLNPIEGFKRWFGIKGILEFVKTLIKVAVVLVVGYLAISGSMEDIVRLHWVDMPAFYRIGIGIARQFIMQVGIAFVFVGAFDYMLQRQQWKKQLMMSKDEVKQEFKESEGDPLIKSQRKALHQQMAMQAITHEVPRADAIVTNPTHIAVAIRYEKAAGGAPKVTAKGGGAVAKIIIELAKKHDVPIIRDISLAHSLFVVEMGRYVPRELYEAVAEVLLFAWRLRQEAQKVPGGI